ncbi:DUF3320 domain-containing protein [Streptomyces sp. NBC_01443]|uniref:DUF3320 domain-containing protein n=1 Tax=Streptomyces sp. NBC_01443 TaxID=2903868 RepID=UPI00224D4228|nr:DUF3320 domain-containing protein [Streptomyces sp. NBC_01443]MCX4627037.1 DUF3320 domain-containing protein [Streptomyces sp. NBC_01443]
MTIDPGTFGGSSDLERLKAILTGWRTSLVDLSGRNRLLNFRHTRTSTLEISAPSPSVLVDLLENRALYFAPLPDEVPAEGEEPVCPPPGEHDVVTQKTTAPALQRALRSLRSKATQVFNDYGLWTLHLGVGVLHWREDGATTSSQAPLILFPVELVRTPTGQVLLQANDDEDPQLNPALPIKLEQFGIDWAPVTETDCRDVTAVVEAVRKAVAGKSQWEVEERAVMALFASHKESMYRDLLENEDRLLASDLVRAVAVGPGDALAGDRFDFEEVPSERVDELAPPEDTPLVLDADTSQRQAVAAAVAGRSFVLDGPPGTGKSQTITNIIAGLMHAGRSVLFVSEKAAALDVVLQRLQSVGLDSYAFALHSRNTSRKAVAQELGRALSEQPQASGLPDQERAQARLDREALSAYATAMNEVREPMGRTLHDVIGQVGMLDDAPVAYLATGDGISRRFDASSLSAADLENVLKAAHAIGGAWQAVADPAFPWRGLRTDVSHPGPALEEARTALSGLLSVLDGYEALNTDGERFTASDQVDRLVRLLRLLDDRLPAPEWWLTDVDIAHSVTDPVESFLGALRRVRRAQQSAQDLIGDRWQELSPRVRSEPPETEQALATLEPRGLDLTGLTERETDDLSRDFGRVADLLGSATASARELTRILGTDEPQSLAEATAVCDLVDLSVAPHRPLEAWCDPKGFTAAQQAALSLVATAVGEFEVRRDRTVAARATAQEHAGPGWADLPSHLPRQPEAAELALGTLEPPGADLTVLGRDEAESLARRWSTLAHRLEGAAKCAVDAADLLGCEPPDTLSGTRFVTGLAALATHAHRAPEAWFDPAVLPRARQAVNELHRLMDVLEKARREAQAAFGPDTPRTAGLTDAVRRLSENGRRFAAGLSSQVRADRKLVGGISTGGSWHSGLQEEMVKAAEWQQAHQAVRAAVTEYGELLAAYAGVELPDLDALDGAIRQAEAAHRLGVAVVADPVRRRRLAAQLAQGSLSDPALLEWGTRLEDDLSTWASALREPRLREHEAALDHLGPAAAAAWLHAHTPALEETVRLIDTVQSVGRREFAGGTGHTLASARTAIAAAHAAQREDAAFAAREADDRELLCAWYTGLDTRLDSRPDNGGGAALEDELLRRAVRLKAADSGLETELDASEAIELLGEYASDGRPLTAALASALAAASDAHRLAGPVLADPVRRSGIVRALRSGQPAVPGLLETAARLRARCADWETFTNSPAVAPVGFGLRARFLHEGAAWLRTHLEPLDEATSLIHAVTRVADSSEGATAWLSLGDARSAVAAVVAARATEEDFLSAEVEHRRLLGDLYDGISTSRETVHSALDWALSARRSASGTGAAAPLAPEAARLLLQAAPDSSVGRRSRDWLERTEVLIGHFAPARAAEVRAELETAFPAARALLDRMADDPYGPDAWLRSAEARAVLSGYGLEELPAQLADREVPASLFPVAVERTVLRAWVEHQLAVDIRLSVVRATDRDQLVERYRRLDRGLVQAAHATVIDACNTRRPRRATTGQAAILSRQAKLQRRHKPVRRLLDETRDVVQRLKPCFMMSPLTVSQFLPPDFHFDVVIFDEASQVLPQDAVNAVYRGDALIVAGDPRQLPPTSFFSVGGDSDDDDEWDEEVPDAFESILDACKASGVLRELSLRWHYRSRHENLIAFSNHEFYEDSMVVFPGAVTDGHDVGVAFYKADGVYDRSNRRDNIREAEVVAERVIQHFSTRPHLTLGIVTLSKAQAEAVEDAVAKARKARPDLDSHFTEDRLGGFFVKNLETVQGDERDVIILSVGYGPDAQGKLRATFGPINREGGWRRLNVAVTRARHRVEVVASFHGSDLSDSANKSVQHLKRYLQYAEQGPAILATAAPDPEAAPESPFEEDVLDTLRSWGYDVQPQVGVAGFRIDMAIRHPGAPGAYALGIECDGAMYHSSRAARDRDRLREEILRGLKWNLHRIWGTDWYRNRKDAQRRLREAVEAACSVDPHAPATGLEPVAVAVPVTAEVEIVPVEESDRSEWSRPYRAMRLEELYELRRVLGRQTGLGNIDLREPEAIDLVAELARHVISVEGPIEEEVLIGRVREAWGLDRAGQIVQASVRKALERLRRKNLAVQAGTAWNTPEHEVTTARTPSADLERKKVLHVPPAERQVALLGILSESPGLQRDELAKESARFFGWLRLGADIRAAFDQDIEALIARNSIEEGPSGLIPMEDRSVGR